MEKLASYCDFLLTVNERMNITALRTPHDVATVLFLDSLSVAAALRPDLLSPASSPRVFDVGSGTGAPGLPIKILFENWSLFLIESIQKKARFLEDAIARLGLADVSVLAERAEKVGADPRYRDTGDLCLARAVASLPALLELCAPLVRGGGFLAFPKSGDVDAEVESADAAAVALHTRLVRILSVPEALGLGAGRAIVLYQKLGPTPGGYPRRVGLATSRPIVGKSVGE
ncbi:MAG TPA: 16S rRNA (guanine(527)-N(7))-methyltransferase RsmG [Chloroflexota bacterium]